MTDLAVNLEKKKDENKLLQKETVRLIGVQVGYIEVAKLSIYFWFRSIFKEDTL